MTANDLFPAAHHPPSIIHHPSPLTRRRFLAETSASVAALTVLPSQLVHGTGANSKIAFGLIGCGGRGRWIADLFQKHGGFEGVAVADYFEDQADKAATILNVPAERRFTGLSGYKRLLEQKLDAVVIESPPYFHPEHAAAAVEAGKHVYMAKPIAVDVPGCLTIAEAGKKATTKKLCFIVDFQTRANPHYQEAARLVHEGELGKIISVEANYHCGDPFGNMTPVLRKDPANPEVRLRAWGLDRTLSGDIITEQNIHALDVACWMLDAQPLRAYGTGGKKRDSAGDCCDHFAVIFYYPDDIVVSFNSHQSGFGYDDILCRVYGLKGTVDTHYFGNVMVKAMEVHSDHNVGNLYSTGVTANIATFHDSITKGECANPTVPASVRSNLTTILGRTAAYKNTMVTWDEMIDKKEKFVADLKGLKT
ncbi:MAG: gfo/Idh/MocA family oxidoreductase [Verrucomicrobia bacterium]|nr:MAG: gfo/Idh/MocA family oxidoreductase [Verrucomicrobiota bacterium]